MFASIEKKILLLKDHFQSCPGVESRYELIIKMGASLPAMDNAQKLPSFQVKGCQSQLFLMAELDKEQKLSFQADSDALISKGLAAVLIYVYNHEPPEVILKYQPNFLNELGIYSSLSPSRSNGLSSLHLHMKRLALNFLVARVD